MRNKTKTINKIKSFIDLEEAFGYIAYDAAPVPNCVISQALHIAISLDYEPFVTPTKRESIQFEWEKDNGDYLKFEIFATEIVVSAIIRGERYTGSFETDAITMNQLNNIVHNFLKKSIYSKCKNTYNEKKFNNVVRLVIALGIALLVVIFGFIYTDAASKKKFTIKSDDFDGNVYSYILVDKQTGVNYIIVEEGSRGIAITPRLSDPGIEYYKSRITYE